MVRHVDIDGRAEECVALPMLTLGNVTQWDKFELSAGKAYEIMEVHGEYLEFQGEYLNAPVGT